VLVSDFDFHLPHELIAQHPPAQRGASRMLHLAGNSLGDSSFAQFPELLGRGDLVVFNDTRVLPARLFGRRSGSRAQPLSAHNPASRDFLHGQVEVLLTRRLPGPEEVWQALVRPGRKIMPGERLYFGKCGEEACAEGGPFKPSFGLSGAVDSADFTLEAEVLARGEFGERTLRFLPVPDFYARLERLGHIPLPPYIDRPDTAEDRQRYQTVFARDPGSVAAPTAGLHFTPETMARLAARGIETATVTLHVGLGTFAPIRSERVEEHHIHTELYCIPPETVEAIQRARREGRRVVAIGTTTVRTLEFAAGGGGWQFKEAAAEGVILSDGAPGKPVVGLLGQEAKAPYSHEKPEGSPLKPSFGLSGAVRRDLSLTLQGEADIFIYPGYRFRVVDAMLTNFHLPKSTLLMLVSAFAGRERTLAAYNHAVREQYRFFSYGDCMFLE
jgi:S-adenosylmethionine:tRNA ribosyltransferase-isomerase